MTTYSTNGSGRPDNGVARDALRADKALPGGNTVPITFSAPQLDTLNSIVDELIPAGGGFPAPSTVRLVEDFFTRYVMPAGSAKIYFPGAEEVDFKAHVDALDGFANRDHDRQVSQLAALEESEPIFFRQLRTLTYAGYYSRPEVVLALRHALPAGRDYHGPPQPYGYEFQTQDWDDALVPPKTGDYIRTDSVDRVALSGR